MAVHPASVGGASRHWGSVSKITVQKTSNKRIPPTQMHLFRKR